MKSDQCSTRNGGKILVDALVSHGVSHLFCVPGESYLPVLDALLDQDSIQTVVCRQEGGAAMMADAYGKLADKPGVCFVTRGPGAANAASGLHVAQQDSTPLILFIGQVEQSMAGREAFQEIDFKLMFGSIAKLVEQIDDPKRIPEIVSRAFHIAVNGRPGPVVITLPEDMLLASAKVEDVEAYRKTESSIGNYEINSLDLLLSNAKRPLVISGGRSWSKGARKAFHKFASNWNLPITAAFRYQDCFDNSNNHYVGDIGIGINPNLKSAILNADLLIVFCVRLGEITTSGYTLISVPKPKQLLIHVYPGVEELGRVYRPTLAINAGPNRLFKALGKIEPSFEPPWNKWRQDLRASYIDWSKPTPQPGSVQLGSIIEAICDEVPRDTIITNGAGNYTGWLHRYYKYRDSGTQLGPTSGSMGYGLPAAIAAKLLNPSRTVVAFAGDGCFLMTSQELATAVQYDLAIVIVVVNNGMYGTIRMHQERLYPGRVSGTDLLNPDFFTYARAFGAHAEKVYQTKDFLPAFKRAISQNRPSLIEIIADPEVISPHGTVKDLQTPNGIAN
jgi:acetolactate synthase-1/2/3 large subunit